MAGDDFLSTIAVSVISKELIPQAQEEATFALAEKHRVDPQSPDFSIVPQADILGTLTQVTDTFTIFLAAVAGISLIVGGIVGVLLGWIISIAVSSFAGIATSVSISSVLLAFGVSAFIGIVFGYYPARRASRLNPIEALRYE